MSKSLAHLLIAAIVLTSPAFEARAGEAAQMCKFEQFAKLVKVTPKQRKAMEKILADLDGELKGWDKTNRAKIGALEAELAKARKSRNMQALCKIMAKKQALQAERAKLAKPVKGKLVAELSTAQRVVWESDMLFQEMHKCFRSFRPDQGQVGEIRSRSDVAGKATAALRAQGKADEIAKVKTYLRRGIVQEVLTPLQRQRFGGSGGKYASDVRETAAQRAERIKLAAMGFAGKRLGQDIDRSNKAVKEAVEESEAATDKRWTSGIATGKMVGGRELMELVNASRSRSGADTLPGHTQLNFSAQAKADELNGKLKQNKLTAYRGLWEHGCWVVGPSTPESAFRSLPRHLGFTGGNYDSVGVGRRGKAWVVMFGNK